MAYSEIAEKIFAVIGAWYVLFQVGLPLIFRGLGLRDWRTKPRWRTSRDAEGDSNAR